MGRPRSSTTARPACSCRPTTRARWPRRSCGSSTTRTSAGDWARPPTSAAASATRGQPSRRRLLRSTAMSPGDTPPYGGQVELIPPDARNSLIPRVTEYTVRRSDRARRLRIVVAPTGVEVVLPRRMALRDAEAFVAEKARWIERTLRQYKAAEAALPPVRLEDGGEIPYLGLTLPIRVHVEPWRTRPGVSR